MKRCLLTVITTLTTVLAVLTSCAAQETPAETQGSIFNWVSAGIDSTINPHDCAALPNYEIVDLITASLYRWVPVDGKAELLPCLAASEPLSEDGLTWLIPINPSAKWASGEPITAEDFVYSWRMGLNPELAYTYTAFIVEQFITVAGAMDYYLGNTGWADVGVKAIDAYTLEIKTINAASKTDVMRHFAHRATSPVYKAIYEKQLRAYGTEAGLFMASGPFMLTEWTKGSERVFEKNPHYIMADMIELDGIYCRVATNEATRIELFESGAADCIDVGLNGLRTYAEDPRLRPYDLKTVRSIEFNRSNPKWPVLSDPLFRKAIYYATDREALAELVSGSPAAYFISTLAILESGEAYRSRPEASEWLPPNYGYNPGLALEYYNEALDKYGLDSLDLTLTYSEDVPTLRAASEFLQADWRRVLGDGFKLSLTPLPHIMAHERMRESRGAETDSWDLCWSGWTLAAETFEPQAKFAPYQSAASNRFTDYDNAFLDESYLLFNQEEYRNNPDLRLGLIVDTEKSVIEDATCVPVFQERAYVLFSERVNLPDVPHTPMLGFAWEYAALGN
ncbi:MAG: ABC transporter substrate-binding protein [Clostridiales bacterium]|jgi:oligopeptide transport system substrate-binding protein|nr:ABC transporter substrate-binding protein [Clostridiales bacterium]